MGIKEEIEKLESKIKELKRFETELYESNTFTLITNTTFLQNSKITDSFDLWKGFKEFVVFKHEAHWRGENSSEVEITFKVLPKKKENKA